MGYCPACLVRLGADGLIPAAELVTPEGTQKVTQKSVAAGGAVYPALFGGYELLGEIGRGGMGVVCRARQLAINRVVALKMLLHGRFSEAAFIERFHIEAEAAAHLDHPNIVPIYEVGQHEGQPFYSMKLVEGQSLDRELSCGPMPPKRAAQLMATVARAVAFAHQHGVLHRDIKPHNILLDADGRPHLSDFGLAKLLNQESGLTVSAAVIGSPGFMAPEQAAGKTRQVTTAADVYGLGAVLYALLTGKPVFRADTPLETVRQVIEQEPVRPRVLNPALDRDLETICLKCLQKEPAKRYASAQALADDLESWLRAEPIQARPVSAVERGWLWCRRQPVRASLLGTLLSVFALGLAGVLWQWRRAEAGWLVARQNAYAADMNLAQRAVEDNEIGRAASLLDKYRPAAGAGPDLRGWEWRYLWQFCQGDESSVLHRYPEGINALAVSKDGRLMALATGTRVALWDLAAKRPIADLPENGGALAFSPAGDLLAVAMTNPGGEVAVHLWDVASRNLSLRLTNQVMIRSLAFSPDGRLLATFDDRGGVQVTDWASGQVLARYSMHTPRRESAGVVAFSPDGRRLAIGGDRGQIELLDWRSQNVTPLKTPTAEGVYAVAFSPSGQTLAAGFGYSEGRIILWDLDSTEIQGQWTNHTTDVCGLAFTPDGRRLVWGDRGQIIGVWNLEGRIEPRYFHIGRYGLTALALLPDGRTLVSGSWGGAVCLWDLQAPERTPAHGQLLVSYGVEEQRELPLGSFAKRDPRVVRRLGVAFTPDSRRLLTTDREGTLGVYDTSSMQLLEPLPALGSNTWGVALSPDGRWLAAGSAAGKVAVWDWTARRLVATFSVPYERFGWLRFSSGGRFLAAHMCSNDRSMLLRVWQTGDWTEIQAGGVRSSRIMGVSDFSPEDRLVWVGYSDGVVKGLRLPTGRPVFTWRTGFPKFHFMRSSSYFLRCSPDGRLLASTATDGSVRLWDVTGSRELPTSLSHKPYAYSVAFSADGGRLASGGDRAHEAVKFWDLATQRELLSLPAEGCSYLNLGFSPDGNILFAVNFSGLAHFWRAPSWAEIKAAEKRAGTRAAAPAE